MQLFVRGQSLHVIDVTVHETAAEVKHVVAEQEGVDVADVSLFFGGRPLDDSSCLLAYDVGSLNTLNVELRMIGGKVHGSLARAGKVKGQTPKVDKQEKKKKLTGRSKRRMQYNRRFVNVVETFGRKKGPNSNSQ